MKRARYVIGIDEAGRGPLAGPVAVGVTLMSRDFDWSVLPGVRDSKKLTSEKRAAIFKQALKLKKVGELDFAVVMVSAKLIDTLGIVPAITRALNRGIAKIIKRQQLSSSQVEVKLDGGLKAPDTFTNQETIIKGDDKELSIGLASIMAKVTRDNYMQKIAKQEVFSVYGFSQHKGYGTKLHQTAIRQNGLSAEHRLCFCRSFGVTK